MTPEQQARKEIDGLLAQAGWHVCDCKAANIHAARGVAIREFPLDPGHGEADYLLYIDGKAAGVVEAKKQGATLSGLERQSDLNPKDLAADVPPGRAVCPSMRRRRDSLYHGREVSGWMANACNALVMFGRPGFH